MSYSQEIYDAVRSKISNGDIGGAVESAIREINISFYAERARDAIQVAAAEYERPSILLKPKLFIDGDQWCALYGENIQDGVTGFGKSPREAMLDFDVAYNVSLPD